MWLTDLAKLADPKYGLTVKFESGWKRRGASGGAQMKSVAGVLWHHDVAPRSGTYPLRNMLRDGRKGLTGPLCHIGFDRDGVVHVVGAGKANHAGTGSVPGVVRNGGNTRLIGIEMTSAGTRPWDWTDAQLRQMPKLGAALSDIFGLSRSKHWAHYEYSNGGKIDPAGLPGAMPGLRSRIAAVRFGGVSVSTGGAGVPTPTVTAAEFADVDKTQRWLTELGYDPGPADGKYGARTAAAVRAAQQDLDINPADGRPGPATRTHLEAAVSTLNDIKAIVTQNQADIRAARSEAKRAADVATVNQGDIRLTRDRVGPIRRADGEYSLRQEIADAKTLAISAEARDQAILRAVQDAAQHGTPVDLDAVTAAAEAGVASAIKSISADVTLTVAEG